MSLASHRLPLRAYLLAVAWLLACGSHEDAGQRREAPLPAPARVASLSPSGSRFLLALGAGDRIVAVDAGSSRIPDLRGLPVADLARAAEMEAEVILWPGTPAGEEALAEQIRATGREVIRFEPHSLDEAFGLIRDLGARLVGDARARSAEIALGRQLAEIGGASFGRPRPRVAGVVGSDPPELAGGHSFLTDLIEIAGGSSVTHEGAASSATHEGAEVRLPVEAERLKALAPDLMLVATPGELSQVERSALVQKLPGGYRVEFLVFDPDRVWTQELVETARRLRAVIEPLSRELERTAREAG